MILIVFLGMVIGTMIGMNIGGNYFTSFTFLGLRGYEATGQIGMVVGGVLFAIIGYLVIKIISKQRKQKHL
jgi:amino acid transporter